MNNGKVYVVKMIKSSFDLGAPSKQVCISNKDRKATEKFITENSGNTSVFQSNSLAYDNSVEIAGSLDTRYTRRMNSTNWGNLFDEFLSGGPEKKFGCGEKRCCKTTYGTDMYETAVDYFRDTSMNEKLLFLACLDLLALLLKVAI